MLHAFWIVILTGIVLVTVAALRRLVDARPSVTRTSAAVALVLKFIGLIPPWDSVVGYRLPERVEFRSTSHELRAWGFEQAVCQAEAQVIFYSWKLAKLHSLSLCDAVGSFFSVRSRFTCRTQSWFDKLVAFRRKRAQACESAG